MLNIEFGCLPGTSKGTRLHFVSLVSFLLDELELFALDQLWTYASLSSCNKDTAGPRITISDQT